MTRRLCEVFASHYVTQRRKTNDNSNTKKLGSLPELQSVASPSSWFLWLLPEIWNMAGGAYCMLVDISLHVFFTGNMIICEALFSFITTLLFLLVCSITVCLLTKVRGVRETWANKTSRQVCTRGGKLGTPSMSPHWAVKLSMYTPLKFSRSEMKQEVVLQNCHGYVQQSCIHLPFVTPNRFNKTFVYNLSAYYLNNFMYPEKWTWWVECSNYWPQQKQDTKITQTFP